MRIIKFAAWAILLGTLMFSCSKNPVIEENIIKKTDGAVAQSVPSGRFTFYLIAPENNKIVATDEELTLKWSQPSPYCDDFIKYNVYVGTTVAKTIYDITSTSYGTRSPYVGIWYWDVWTYYGNNLWKTPDNGPFTIFAEIDPKIVGPNPIYSRSNQEWKIKEVATFSSFIYNWKVFNLQGQQIVNVSTEKLSINQFPSVLPNGKYKIYCDITSSSGKTYKGKGSAAHIIGFELTVLL